MGEELRKEPRFPSMIRVRLEVGGAEIDARTRTVSLSGVSVALPGPDPLEEALLIKLHLPDDVVVEGRATPRGRTPEGVTGFSLDVEGEAKEAWESYVAQEATTGSLWRMIGRFSRARGDEKEAVRSVLEEGALGVLFKRVPTGLKPKSDEVALRYHMVGENGEAYRVLFEKHGSKKPQESALWEVRGFEQLTPLIKRVLDEEVTVRFADDKPATPIRVCELTRGNYAHVVADGRPASLVSLCVGELMLIEVDGERVHPHFTDDDLERIGCDTFRMDTDAAMFASPEKKARRAAAKPEVSSADHQHVDTSGEVTGPASIRRAQEMSETRQARVYGERTIELYPEVWGRAKVDNSELMGPTMFDGTTPLLLGLVGPGAPRVLKLTDDVEVALLAGGRTALGW
jgi:hypothetical protein